MTVRSQRGLVAAVPAALSAAALSAPIFASFGYTLSAFALFQFSNLICHQDPTRCFWIAGMPMAVCARCTGVYLGAAAGAWLTAPRRKILQLLAVTVGVSLLDYSAELAGLHGNWPLLRFVLGLSLGSSLGALVVVSANRPL